MPAKRAGRRLAGRARVLPRALARRFLRLQKRDRPAAPHRILVAHHLLAGDVFMLAPLLAKLRARHADAEIVMTVRPALAPLFSTRPYGVRAVSYDPRDAATLDALFEVMKETGAASNAIDRMVVHGNEQVRVQFDRPRIESLLDAQFSFQYALAVGAVSGRATLDQFVPFRYEEPEVQRLMGATSVVADRSMKPGDYPPLEIRFTDGRTVERHIPFAKGAPENPLSDDELRRKAVSQIEPVLGEAHCSEILACVSALDSVTDFGALMRLLVLENEAGRARGIESGRG